MCPSVREPLPSCQWLQPLDVYLKCLPEADQDPFAGEAREQGVAEAEGGVTHHTLFLCVSILCTTANLVVEKIMQQN